MKKLTVILAALLLLAALTACGGGNTLFDAVRTEGSSIHFHIYDGKISRQSWLYGDGFDALLTRLKAVPVKLDEDWSHADLTLPIYGFTATKRDGTQFQIAFSNGRAITADGVAYRFNLDFDRIAGDYAWDEEWFETAEAAIFPCGQLLLIDNGSWRTDLMLPAPALTPPEGITAELTRWNGGEIEITFRNDSQAEWMFGTHFHVDVCVDGLWYTIPEKMSDYPMGFTDIGYMLLPDSTRRETYNVSAYYGLLPDGQYRIVAYGLEIPFTQSELFSAGGEPEAANTLFDAIPVNDRSGIEWFIYDGETTRSFDLQGESFYTLMQMLKLVPVKLDEDWTPADVTLPIYAISTITPSPIHAVSFAFSNGRVITDRNVAYTFASSLDWIEQNLAPADNYRIRQAADFPCDRLLLIDDQRPETTHFVWRADLLAPAKEASPPDGITAEVTRWNGNILQVTFRSRLDTDLQVYDDFTLQLFHDGYWRTVPRDRLDDGLSSGAQFTIPAQGSVTVSYPILQRYGSMPDSTYRLEAHNGCTVEFGLWAYVMP